MSVQHELQSLLSLMAELLQGFKGGPKRASNLEKIRPHRRFHHHGSIYSRKHCLCRHAVLNNAHEEANR